LEVVAAVAVAEITTALVEAAAPAALYFLPIKHYQSLTILLQLVLGAPAVQA
jgi:hypothetical protein